MSKHTPTPWRVFDTGNGAFIVTDGGGAKVVIDANRDGKIVVRDRRGILAPATIEDGILSFIVRACNAHDELVAAAKDCLQDLTDMEPFGAAAHASAVHRAKRLRDIIAKAEAQA